MQLLSRIQVEISGTQTPMLLITDENGMAFIANNSITSGTTIKILVNDSRF